MQLEFAFVSDPMNGVSTRVIREQFEEELPQLDLPVIGGGGSVGWLRRNGSGGGGDMIGGRGRETRVRGGRALHERRARSINVIVVVVIGIVIIDDDCGGSGRAVVIVVLKKVGGRIAAEGPRRNDVDGRIGPTGGRKTHWGSSSSS